MIYTLSLLTVHIKTVAINAVCMAFGTDPTMQEYDRAHAWTFDTLPKTNEQNEMLPFPARSGKSSFADGVRCLAYLKVFCSCEMIK